MHRSDRPIARGGDKNIYEGTYNNEKVAIAVSKPLHGKRLRDEIRILKELGIHENIIKMYHYNDTDAEIFIVLERVEPIGSDFDRLKNQISLANQTVPTVLTLHLLQQVCRGLTYMHSKGFIHRDLKLQNVLITSRYDAKIIDMGIACRIGQEDKRWIFLPKTYLAPEVCMGSTQGPEVDCWGVGFLIHQIYQHRVDLVDATGDAIQLRPNRPSYSYPMEPRLKELMGNLLVLDRARRWTLSDMERKVFHSLGDVVEERVQWPTPSPQTDQPDALYSRYFCPYVNRHPPPMAYAVQVTQRKTPQLINKSIGSLKVREKTNCTILLIDEASDQPKFTFVFPDQGCIIKENMWIYLGLPSDDQSLDDARRPFHEHFGIEGNVFLPFTLEFDVFEFPEHIGEGKIIGKGGPDDSLDLRAAFKINLAGVLHANQQDPVWFPGPERKVSAGDYGLIVRCPCRDGTTVSITTDEGLAGLMSAKSFKAAQAR